MKGRRRILLVFGTRPEAIKMAPVVQALKDEAEFFDVGVCVTAQHRDMLDQVLEIFSISPDYDLDLMRSGQSLHDITSGVLTGIRDVLKVFQPDIVLVHGDTTTSFAASLAAFYEKISVGHVEAGLRTGNIYSPFPEEMNRKLTGAIARLHFAPTETNRSNLLGEGIAAEKIFVTGNTVIDALLHTVQRTRDDQSLRAGFEEKFSYLSSNKRLVLVTAHRRENHGDGIRNICAALQDLIASHDDIEILFPVHPNPNVLDIVNESLGNIPRIHLAKPFDYLDFSYLLKRSYLVLSDSGGVQEEAPGLGKPVLVLRDTTERPEAVEAGTVKLVATERSRIVQEASRLLNDAEAYKTMSRSANPYGNGTAAKQIASLLKNVDLT